MARKLDLNFHQNKKLRVLYNTIIQDFKYLTANDITPELIEEKVNGINGLMSTYKNGELNSLIKDLILIILTRC